MRRFIALLICVMLCTSFLFTFVGCVGSNVSANINAEDLGVNVDDTLYGLFLEDISYACDGGLVSNLVNNGSFEYTYSPFSMWEFDNIKYELSTESPLNDSNTHYTTLAVNGGVGQVTNLGYVEYYDYLTDNYNQEKMSTADMGFVQNNEYLFTCYFKNIDFVGDISVQLSSPNNNIPYTITLQNNNEWQKIETTLTSLATEDGSLTIKFEGTGDICMDFATLENTASYGFNNDAWKYVSLRSDLYTALENLNPAFIRFPGGCLAEGDSLENLFDWKETIGDLSQRKQFYNIWNDDENGKTYNNTFAMGYHEYFQLCADLGAAPLPILNAGMICQFEAKYNANYKAYSKGKMTQSAWESYLDTVALRPGTETFDAYIQDIFDLIEYANGDTSTYWGNLRAENGSPQPFNLQYIGIGNENWGELYFRNFDAIYTAIKEKHPEIKIISSAGYSFSGERYENSWEIINEKYTDTLVDEHYYTSREKLFKNNDRYDKYERNGVTVFVGEYAASSWGFGKLITKNNIWSAIEEAGYLTSLERNGDIVKMAAYAPTFAKINSQCWEINMIWFDSHNIVLTPNYYVQMLYANNTGSQVINTNLNKNGVYSTTTYDKDTQTIYVKLVNSNKKSFTLDLNLEGFSPNSASKQYIYDESKGACNQVGTTTVLPQQSDCVVNGNRVSTQIDGYSVNVIRIYYGDNDGSNAYDLPATPSNMSSELTEYTGVVFTAQAKITLGAVSGFILICVTLTVAIILIKKYLMKKATEKQTD